MKSNPKISVFTATLNRKYTLERVFNSLQIQTYRDFEWLIIDDGSTDGTEDLVKEFKSKADFKIRYYWQVNRGKHTAYNLFAKHASGIYYCSIDSDDEVRAECLERLLLHFEEIPDNERGGYAGVMCLAENQFGGLIGEKFFDDDFNDNLVGVIIRHKNFGDKGGLSKISVLREFPFPEDVERVYVPESYHHHGYSSVYKTKFVNEILIRPWIDPRADHLSQALQRRSNYPGTAYGLLCFSKYSMRYFFRNPKLFIAVTSKYVAVALSTQKGVAVQYNEIGNIYGRLLWVLLLPLGYVRYIIDRLRTIRK